MKIAYVNILGVVGYVIFDKLNKPFYYYGGMDENNNPTWVDFLYNAKSYTCRKKAEDVLVTLSLAEIDDKYEGDEYQCRVIK